MSDTELKVKEKKEVQHVGEPTKPVRNYVPAVDIYETEESVTVIAEMPGVCKDCIEVGLDGGVLTIKGWQKEVDEKSGETVLLSEFEIGNFLRRFEVSETIVQDKIEARISDGMLTILLPKIEPAKPRKIEIKTA